jgi:two-component system sensor histidine kinase UhpB
MKKIVEHAEPVRKSAGDATSAAPLEQRLEKFLAESPAIRTELDTFAHSIAHDLRGPLMHIGGFADLLSDHCGAQLDDKGREYLRTIIASADQLGRMLAAAVAHAELSRPKSRNGTAGAKMPPGKKEAVGDFALPPTPIADGGSGPEKNSPPSAPEELRILLVEDSAADVELIKHTLRVTDRKVSMTLVETRDAFEAELTRRPPHLILSDYWLPTFDGIKAMEIAKQIAPRVPFIFVTGTLGEEVAIDMLKQGATDYVLKNRLTRLTPAVSRALSETEQRRERELAEENFRRSHEQLRALTGHLQFVREEERTRIAREVHDELGQALTGLKIDLSWLAGKLPGARGLQTKMKSMSAQIDATIHTVRRIATELRPGVLDSLGLAAAIEWQAAEFQERTGIRCEMKIDVTEKIWERNFSTACFRIFQETLTNIIRHANATCVEVRLAQDDHELVLTVSDNGRGITETEIAHPRSIGLAGMKERATQVGGEVSFSGQPGQGTVVTLRVPLPAAVAIGVGDA